MLEKSPKLDLLAEVGPEERTEADLLSFHPNRIVEIKDDRLKKEILESFYWDAAREDGPASCFEPHHALRAEVEGITIQIEICFTCARFQGTGEFHSLSGTIVRKGRKTERLFESLVAEQGVQLN